MRCPLVLAMSVNPENADTVALLLKEVFCSLKPNIYLYHFLALVTYLMSFLQN